jgi:hemoglobin
MATAYELLGREEGLERLVERFYAAMDRPEHATIRALHPADLATSRRNLWMFLVGRFGGPPLYEREKGHPRLRARHLPFPIGAEEARQWMACMDLALAECVAHEELRKELRDFFAAVAEQMRNTAD